MGGHKDAVPLGKLPKPGLYGFLYDNMTKGMINLCFVLWDDVVPEGFEVAASNDSGQFCVRVR